MLFENFFIFYGSFLQNIIISYFSPIYYHTTSSVSPYIGFFFEMSNLKNFWCNTVFWGEFTPLSELLLVISCALNINTTVVNSLIMAAKFLFCIAFLIFARGGIPRFRFDYLTKLGWIRFLSLVLLSFTIEILIINIF